MWAQLIVPLLLSWVTVLNSKPLSPLIRFESHCCEPEFWEESMYVPNDDPAKSSKQTAALKAFETKSGPTQPRHVIVCTPSRFDHKPRQNRRFERDPATMGPTERTEASVNVVAVRQGNKLVLAYQENNQAVPVGKFLWENGVTCEVCRPTSVAPMSFTPGYKPRIRKDSMP